jgi:DNA-binding transcriptional LysR family regulator
MISFRQLFRQLEIFRAVVSRGAFSRAARDLGITQPAVSLQMKQLQSKLDVPLFRAAGKRLELTSAGATLDGYAEQILRLLEEAQAAVALRSRRLDLVRVAASSTPGVNLLPPLIARFRRRRPDATVRLQVLNTEGVEERVTSGEADLGVVGGQLARAQLEVKPWRQDELVLIVPPVHRLSRRRRIAAKELAGETLLQRERGSATRASYEAAFLRAGVALPAGNEVGSTEAIKRAVAAAMGVGIVSRSALIAELRTGALCGIRIEDVPLVRPLFILLAPGAKLSVAAAAFLDFLRGPRGRGSARGS